MIIGNNLARVFGLVGAIRVAGAPTALRRRPPGHAPRTLHALVKVELKISHKGRIDKVNASVEQGFCQNPAQFVSTRTIR